MTYRQNESSSKDNYSRPQSRLNQQIRSEVTDEGCPVIEESGTVCGETYSLGIFQEFRQMYDDCLRKLEASESGHAILRKLTPFKKLIDDLWAQNTMLVETVEELEQEAACRVTNLQDRLNKCCQKMCDYKDDVQSLVTVVQCLCKKGFYDISGTQFKTFCSSEFGNCEKSCVSLNKKEDTKVSLRNKPNHLMNPCYDNYQTPEDEGRVKYHLEETGIPHPKNSYDVNGMLKAKEREVECLLNKLMEKDEMLKNCCCQIEELKKDLRNKCLMYQEMLKQLKAAYNEGNKVNGEAEQDICGNENVSEILSTIVRNIEDQRKSVMLQLQNADCQIKALASEKKVFLKERTEIASQLQNLKYENEKLLREVTGQKKIVHEKEELLKTVDALKSEKNDLLNKLNILQDNIQELSNNFKETRWALTSEVAEKHDQVQELKRCVGVLEEQLRQADMQTHFKDDIIKELRKELKVLRKSERRGLYDVVNEIRERKNETASNVRVVKSPDMSKCPSNVIRSDAGCYSASAGTQEGNTENKITNENEKFISQIECLKKSLKLRVEEVKAQEEFMRHLEEELTKTKMDLTVLQEKYECQERHSQSGASPALNSDLGRNYATLTCVANRIEEMLKNLSAKQNCGLQNCKGFLQEEIQKICVIKNDLEKGKPKIHVNAVRFDVCNEKSDELDPCSDPKCNADVKSSASGTCDLLHVEDVEKFKEKAVTGVVALEQMKEQIDILTNLIRNYVEEFPCPCDKTLFQECEEKLERSRAEFDNVTYQLCILLQRLGKNSAGSIGSVSFDSTLTCKDEGKDNSQDNTSLDEICGLRSECEMLQKQIADQGNEAEKLKMVSKQLDQEIQEKRRQLSDHTREMESKMCEIYKLREIIRKVSRRLKEGQCECEAQKEDVTLSSPRSAPNLSSLFCDLQEFRSILEQSGAALFDSPKKLREENEKLKEKLACLEKCVCNKDETLRVLQDTMKLRECQVEELKCRMQTSESYSTKLSQDVEEKCRLIANLQEAVRKCKQFEVNSALVESLRFEYCELECKLEKYEKEVLLKDQKLERLHNEITDLSCKNLNLTEKLKIMSPKLKIMYKTCHLFEKMVNELQEELSNRDCEIESLYEKIKGLEEELELELKKCEEKAAEDSKCIEELSLRIKNFQNELLCTQENYKLSMTNAEIGFKRELEMRERDLCNTINHLKAEIHGIRTQGQGPSKVEAPKIVEFENIVRQAESRSQIYEKKIMQLQAALERITAEHEDDKKHIFQMLCEEKKENVKNKNDIHNLKSENHQLMYELEARKKIMCAMETDAATDLTEFEELICSLKIQKGELKTRYCNLKAELDKEVKAKKMLECRVEELNVTLQSKVQEFNQLVENYKAAFARIERTQATMKEIEKNLICPQNVSRSRHGVNEVDEYNCLKTLLDAKTAENAKLFCEIQALKIEIQTIQTENAATRANKDCAISRLHYDLENLGSTLREFQDKCQKLNEENKNLNKQLDSWSEKCCALENEFREKEKDLSARLRTTLCEKNNLFNSLEQLQKQLEQMCLDAENKEKVMKEMSGRKVNNQSSDATVKSKSEKIICNLTKEVKTLHCQLVSVKENLCAVTKQYKNLMEEFKFCEKKKSNLEKIYVGLSNENRQLAESNASYERELCELKEENLILKDKMSSKEGFKVADDKKKLCEKIRELTQKLKLLENKVIPELERELSEKICCIENLSLELQEANMSSQRLRNEALKVIQHTRKYLAAQRFANDSLKSRLECSNKRGNMLGIENRELEEQLKAVTRMNEFLLCQLESNKSDMGEAEPRSFSPLPWGCSTVERDTSSSEYLAESGFQSMQPSPTNMDYQDPQFDSKRNCSHWGNLKKNKCGGSVECPSHRNGVSPDDVNSCGS